MKMNAPLASAASPTLIADSPIHTAVGAALSPSSGLGQTRSASIHVISDNAIFRTCLARCLGTMTTDLVAKSYSSLAEWRAEYDEASKGVILLCTRGDVTAECRMKDDLGSILAINSAAKILVISDVENSALVRTALAAGSRGVASMNIDLEVLVGAIRLVAVGGTFVPASSLLAMRSEEQEPEANSGDGFFSRRQRDVLDYLRQGNPNKIIAFKLKMSEATVKIHVRNMMRKMNARNRTELIFKSHSLAIAA
jgi:DNA-binding NarL/FixJ family response regulator